MKYLIFVFITLIPLSKSFASCASEEQIVALNTRALQSHLMVAALSCQNQNKYNKFIKSFKKELSKNDSKITEYFTNNYGKNYMPRLDNFVTNLANKASERSLNSNFDTYCERSSQLFNKIIKNRPELETISSNKKFSSLHGIRSCY